MFFEAFALVTGSVSQMAVTPFVKRLRRLFMKAFYIVNIFHPQNKGTNFVQESKTPKILVEERANLWIIPNITLILNVNFNALI